MRSEASYTEDQLFEIIAAAVFGAASDRLAAAHARWRRHEAQ